MYRRATTGATGQGMTRQFIQAMGEAIQYQEAKGIRARTSVWGSMTGHSNGVYITSDFENLDALDRFEDMVEMDREFARVRGEVRKNMVFDSEVTILRLAYHSEGSITSESTTKPRHFLRVLSGEVQPGKNVEFTRALQRAVEYQDARGIDASTSIWRAVTGKNSAAFIMSEFDTLAELEKFEDLVARDAEFGELRRAARSAMIFGTAQVAILRNLL